MFAGRGRSQYKKKMRCERAKGVVPSSAKATHPGERKSGLERAGRKGEGTGEEISRGRREKVRALTVDGPDLWKSVGQRVKGAGWGSRA